MLTAETAQYEPTTEDRLWLLRAVAAEGPPQDMVASALVSGFMWALARRRWNRGLAWWVRAYAQPVNPRWFEDGDLHLAALAKAAASDRGRLVQAARRREHFLSHRTVFSAATHAAVDRALAAPVTHATDYAAPHVDRSSDPGWREVMTRNRPGDNRFWMRPGTEGWSGYVGSRVATLGASVLVVAALLLLARVAA